MHRFTNEWEKTVSLALRHVHIRVIDTCLDHDCLREGDEDALTDAAFIACVRAGVIMAWRRW
ncbi:hypothetical protein HMPREF9058_2102 [Actinomyces sp. oral taxon 175 str. F0384]|nr:hypothetical protein HMPREF9058_2102 [Actinomyces sp. oral taxon 175 str. F0384]